MKTAAPSDALTASEQLCGAGRGAQRACPGGGRTERDSGFLSSGHPLLSFGLVMTHPELTENTLCKFMPQEFGVASQFFLGSY